MDGQGGPAPKSNPAPASPRYDPALCPVRNVMARFGDKWSTLALIILKDGPLRFTELRREMVGVSQRMLTQTLRKLEREGLVRRTVTPIIPPRVDYALTPLGVSLLQPLCALASWATEHRAEIEEARAEFDGRDGSPSLKR